MAETITVDEWQRFLDQLETQERNGLFTVAEIAEIIHRNPRWIREKIKRGIHDRKIHIGRKRIVDMAGKTTTVPAYSFVLETP